ncbi:MAG: helix-turn-helix transcriptional regulator [Pseudomonadota bacterium]
MVTSFHSADYEKLTTLLVEARRKSGLTQQAVADRLGRPQSYVAKIEVGERRLDIVEFIHLVRAMDAAPEDILAELLASF